jgi:hypothetical protein
VECIGVAVVVRRWIFGLLVDEALYSHNQMKTVVAACSMGAWQVTRT